MRRLVALGSHEATGRIYIYNRLVDAIAHARTAGNRAAPLTRSAFSRRRELQCMAQGAPLANQAPVIVAELGRKQTSFRHSGSVRNSSA